MCHSFTALDKLETTISLNGQRTEYGSEEWKKICVLDGTATAAILSFHQWNNVQSKFHANFALIVNILIVFK